MVAIDPAALIQDLIAKKVVTPNPAGQRYNNIGRKNLEPADRSAARQGYLLTKLGITSGYAPDFKSENKYLDEAEEMLFRANQLNSKAAQLRTYRPMDFVGGPTQTGYQIPAALIRQVKMEQQLNRAGYAGKGKGQRQPVAQGQNLGKGRFADFVRAIAGKESGGSYQARNPDSGAMGKYQIMQSNIEGPGGWDMEILGKNITPQQFMNSPKLQDAIALGKLKKYFNQYGVRGAASAWYSGDPNKWRNTSPQGGYPSIAAYVQDILRRMGK